MKQTTFFIVLVMVRVRWFCGGIPAARRLSCKTSRGEFLVEYVPYHYTILNRALESKTVRQNRDWNLKNAHTTQNNKDRWCWCVWLNFKNPFGRYELLKVFDFYLKPHQPSFFFFIPVSFTFTHHFLSFNPLSCFHHDDDSTFRINQHNNNGCWWH